MDAGSWHCTGDRDQDHPHGKEMQKSKMAVWGGLTNSWKKRNKKQRRKGKIYPFDGEAMAPHSSTLAWKIPWMEEPGRLQSMELLRVGHDSVTSLSLFTFMHWRRKWQPTPVFLPGESQGWWSLPSMGSHRVGHDWSNLAAAYPFECRDPKNSKKR